MLSRNRAAEQGLQGSGADLGGVDRRRLDPLLAQPPCPGLTLLAQVLMPCIVYDRVMDVSIVSASRISNPCINVTTSWSVATGPLTVNRAR